MHRDLVSMDEVGYMYAYGRIASAQRWKVGGDVVYSIGIESVLRTHPKVRSCMVRPQFVDRQDDNIYWRLVCFSLTFK